MSKKREILVKMNKETVKPSQKQDPKLAASFLSSLIHEAGMSFNEAEQKIMQSFKVDSKELLREYEKL